MGQDLINEELAGVVVDVWSTMLGVPLSPLGNLEEAHKELETISGVVHILGSWQGSVSLLCTRKLAELSAVKFFDLDQDKVPNDLVIDAMKELTNMIGGNIKSSMGERCVLSVPKALKQNGFSYGVPETDVINETVLEHEGCPIVVRVHEGFLEIPEPT